MMRTVAGTGTRTGAAAGTATRTGTTVVAAWPRGRVAVAAGGPYSAFCICHGSGSRSPFGRTGRTSPTIGIERFRMNHT